MIANSEIMENYAISSGGGLHLENVELNIKAT